MRDPIRYVDAYGADSQGYESPKQPNIQYVSGGKLQSFYNTSGELIYQVPLGTKLPKGAKITDVTYSKNETGESVANISYLTLEQQKTLEELEGDAPKWKQAGFTEYAGKAFFPDLAEYGEGAYLGRNEAGEPAIFTPAPQADSTGLNNIDTLNSIDAATVKHTRSLPACAGIL